MLNICIWMLYYSCSLLWKLAPAKLSLFPSTVKSHLFPQYHGLSRPQSSNQTKIVVKIPEETDIVSHSRKESARIGLVHKLCIYLIALLSYRSTSLEFRSLIDFSKYRNKDLPKLVPFPDSTNTVHESSVPSCSSSDASLFTTDTATVSESQRATTQSSSGSDDDDIAIVVDVADVYDVDGVYDKEETSSSVKEMDRIVSTYVYALCVYSCVHVCLCVLL